VFDTRFASARIRKKVAGLLGRELGFAETMTIDFETITDYLALVVNLSRRLGFGKREVYRATRAYSVLADELRAAVPARVFDMIVHTDNRAKVAGLDAWVRRS
jgi:hypothetical protein